MELITREVEFLHRMAEVYKLKAEGAAKAFESIAEIALDTDSLEDMVRHLEVMSEHSHLEDKHPDFWLWEMEFYNLAKKLFIGLNTIRKENNNGQ